MSLGNTLLREVFQNNRSLCFFTVFMCVEYFIPCFYIFFQVFVLVEMYELLFHVCDLKLVLNYLKDNKREAACMGTH